MFGLDKVPAHITLARILYTLVILFLYRTHTHTHAHTYLHPLSNRRTLFRHCKEKQEKPNNCSSWLIEFAKSVWVWLGDIVESFVLFFFFLIFFCIFACFQLQSHFLWEFKMANLIVQQVFFLLIFFLSARYNFRNIFGWHIFLFARFVRCIFSLSLTRSLARSALLFAHIFVFIEDIRLPKLVWTIFSAAQIFAARIEFADELSKVFYLASALQRTRTKV